MFLCISFNYRHLASNNGKLETVIVGKTIEQYRDIVDTEDYYADCREKYKHIKLPDLSKRPQPSKLTDVSKYINAPLPCAGKYEACKEMEVTDEDLKSFQVPLNDMEFDFDELTASIEACINDKKSEIETTTPSSSLIDDFPKPSFSKQVSVDRNLPFNFNTSPQPCSSKSIQPSDDSLNDKKSTQQLKQSNLNAMYFKPQINRVVNSSNEAPIVKKRKLSSPPTTTSKSNLYPDFKSSLDELRLQNAKQNKNSIQQSYQSNPNPVAVMRKSVGLSKPFKVPLEASSSAPEPEPIKYVYIQLSIIILIEHLITVHPRTID